MKTQPCSYRHLSRSRLLLAAGVVAALMGGNVIFAKPGNEKGKGKGNGKAVGQAADFIPPGHRRAPVEAVVVQAPPALRIEVKSARPSAAHVWVPGFWSWEGNSYAWISSVWMLPPAPAAVWTPPRYEPRSGINVFISGYWRL